MEGAPPTPRAEVPHPTPRILSLLILGVCAVTPGIVACSTGAPVWVMAGVVPMVLALVVLAHDHDQRIHMAARRLDTVERERARLADSVRHVGRAFGSGMDLSALSDVMARTASDALGARRSLVWIDGQTTHGGPADAGLDDLLADVAGAAAQTGATAQRESACGHKAIAQPLRNGDGVLAVARHARPFTDEDRGMLTWLAGQVAVGVENVALHERLVEQAQIDELTGLGNRRVFHETLRRELTTGARNGASVSLILLDLDDFKLVNDTYGHPAGDRVLVDVAAAVKANVRSTDTVVRWGGEEFAVVLPNTDARGARTAAEAVHSAIADTHIALPNGASLRVTASVGVATAPRDVHAPDAGALYAVADRALYRAKQDGKNRVAVARPSHLAGVTDA